MSAELAAAQVSGQTLDKQLSEARATMEKYLRDYDTLFNRTQKLTEDLEDQVSCLSGSFVATRATADGMSRKFFCRSQYNVGFFLLRCLCYHIDILWYYATWTAEHPPTTRAQN